MGLISLRDIKFSPSSSKSGFMVLHVTEPTTNNVIKWIFEFERHVYHDRENKVDFTFSQIEPIPTRPHTKILRFSTSISPYHALGGSISPQISRSIDEEFIIQRLGEEIVRRHNSTNGYNDIISRAKDL